MDLLNQAPLSKDLLPNKVLLGQVPLRQVLHSPAQHDKAPLSQGPLNLGPVSQGPLNQVSHSPALHNKDPLDRVPPNKDPLDRDLLSQVSKQHRNTVQVMAPQDLLLLLKLRLPQAVVGPLPEDFHLHHDLAKVPLVPLDHPHLPLQFPPLILIILLVDLPHLMWLPALSLPLAAVLLLPRPHLQEEADQPPAQRKVQLQQGNQLSLRKKMLTHMGDKFIHSH